MLVMADGKENPKWRKHIGDLVNSLPDTCISITVSEFENASLQAKFD